MGGIIGFFVIIVLIGAFFEMLYEESLVAFIVVLSITGAIVLAIIIAVVYSKLSDYVPIQRKYYRKSKNPKESDEHKIDEDILQFITPVTPPKRSSEETKAETAEECSLQVADNTANNTPVPPYLFPFRHYDANTDNAAKEEVKSEGWVKDNTEE
ncbi:MAG: hypothetical protein LUE27_06050 [Clostridia bacterium]|nr:hypothetical protein [Clostridia bacterium]